MEQRELSETAGKSDVWGNVCQLSSKAENKDPVILKYIDQTEMFSFKDLFERKRTGRGRTERAGERESQTNSALSREARSGL